MKQKNMILRKIINISALIFSVIFYAQEVSAQGKKPPFIDYMDHPWVDSVMNTLTTDKQIAQCIWIAAFSNKDVEHEVEVTDLIRKHGIGGLIFFQGNAEKQAELTNYYQKISSVPLLIAMDAEWGLGMRLTNIEKFPFQMTLGAIENDSLIYIMGRTIAAQCRRLGVHVNLAPVADINNNPANPVINYRSFGEDRENVALKSIAYMKGLQENGVMATIKHFPGHGDTDIDSHYDLPVINHSRPRLDSLELYPFRKAIDEGAGIIMTAHLNLPLIDNSGVPSTLSTVIIRDLLKKELGFEGLVVSDAMNMKGVTKYFKPGEAEALAMLAGNDVIEYVPNVSEAIREIKKLLTSNKMTSEDLSLKCRKIIALKYWSGLNNIEPVEKSDLTRILSDNSVKAFTRELYSKSITVLNNVNDLIPVKDLQTTRIATVAINRTGMTIFQDRIEKYTKADHYFIDPADTASCNKLLKRLYDYDLIIAGILGTDQRPQMNFGVKPGLNEFIGKLVTDHNSIITWFGNPYGLNHLGSLENAAGLIITYQENEHTQDLAAQLIFGGIGSSGKLPVTVNGKWPLHSGLRTPGNLRMQYGLPENGGISSEILNRKIDSIATTGLMKKAYPGCEVMIARKGIVVFHKTYGYQTYDNRVELVRDDLFDLASVTKVAATLPGLMVLDTDGKFSPEEKLGNYLRVFKRSDKADLILKDMLTHQAGLTAWIPFWKETVRKNGEFRRNTYNNITSGKYPYEVANGLYINKNYRNKIFKEIRKSPLGEKKYVYSDLTFIIVPEIISSLTGQRWSDFVTDSVFRKIGAWDMTFNPYQKYPLSRIVPTEYDSLFRKQLLQGTVHDEGAAMLGGISGHAGLFSTANDLMKLMELYRRMGEYGGEQLISRDVLLKYSSVQFPENNNRRGMGFDKPLLNNSEVPEKDSYPTKSVSPLSFGHSGFTGTFVWVDPVWDISYIFLSNRVYPTRNNNLLSSMNIRTSILQAVYDSIDLTPPDSYRDPLPGERGSK